MTVLKHILGTALAVSVLTGCLHTETIQITNLSQERSHEINRSMPGYVAKLTFADGTAVRGRSVRITPDSVSWIGAKSNVLRTRPLITLNNVSYHDALKGAGKGALVGAGTGIVLGFGWSIRDIANKSTSTTVPPHFVALTAAAIVGLPGSIAGGAIGAIVGERNQYVFTDD